MRPSARPGTDSYRLISTFSRLRIRFASTGYTLMTAKMWVVVLCLRFLACYSAFGQEQGSPTACIESLQEIQSAVGKLQAELQTLERAAERIQQAARASVGQLPSRVEREQRPLEPIDWERARNFYDQGKYAEDRKQCDQAVLNYTKALQIDRSSDATLQHRGSCRYQMGDLTGALADLDECLQIQPNNAQAYGIRASIRKSMGQREEAIADLTELIRRDETNVEALSMRALLYSEAKEDQRALADYGTAVRLHPTIPRIYMERARVYRKLMDLPSALGDCERARVLDSQSPGAHLCLAETQLAMRNADLAFDEVTEALRLDPNFPGADAVLSSVRGVQRFESLVKPSEAAAYNNRSMPTTTTSIGDSKLVLDRRQWVDGSRALAKQVPRPELDKKATRALVIIIDGLDEGPVEVPFNVEARLDRP